MVWIYHNRNFSLTGASSGVDLSAKPTSTGSTSSIMTWHIVVDETAHKEHTPLLQIAQVLFFVAHKTIQTGDGKVLFGPTVRFWFSSGSIYEPDLRQYRTREYEDCDWHDDFLLCQRTCSVSRTTSTRHYNRRGWPRKMG